MNDGGEQPGPADLDADLVELLAIREALDNSTDHARNIELRDRQRNIRARWKQDLESLSQADLRALERNTISKRQEAIGRRMDIGAAGAGGDGAGLDPLETIRHNRRVDETNGLSEIEGDLLRIQTEIERRKI